MLAFLRIASKWFIRIANTVLTTSNALILIAPLRSFSKEIDSKMFVTSITSRRVVRVPKRPKNIRNIVLYILANTKDAQGRHDQRQEDHIVPSIDVTAKDARHYAVSLK